MNEVVAGEEVGSKKTYADDSVEKGEKDVQDRKRERLSVELQVAKGRQL